MAYLTDAEKRILFSALAREEKVCKTMDRLEKPKGTPLVKIVESLRKKFYYDRFEKEIRAKAIDEVMEIVKKAYHNFSGYDLEFMTKYGNKNASQQAESYSTLMMYEIAGEFDDLLDSLEQLKGGAE